VQTLKLDQEIKQRVIAQKAQEIKNHRAKLNVQEQELQEICEHPAAKKTYRRNTGWEAKDTFSTDFYCSDCDKHWTMPGSL
jgi:hypothetical protein